MVKPVVPAIIPDSADAVRAAATQLAFSHELHLDVVDGKFVPYRSWPYEPEGDPRDTKSLTDRFTLEVDLMVASPLPAAAAWLQAGADMLVFHVETLSVEEFRGVREMTKISLGICALNDTLDDVLLSYLPYADYVQVMGIAQIGAQGQPFDERALARIAMIKQAAPQLMVSVDGSINTNTIARAAAAGADRFIAGSAVVRAADPYAAYTALCALTN